MDTAERQKRARVEHRQRLRDAIKEIRVEMQDHIKGRDVSALETIERLLWIGIQEWRRLRKDDR